MGSLGSALLRLSGAMFALRFASRIHPPESRSLLLLSPLMLLILALLPMMMMMMMILNNSRQGIEKARIPNFDQQRVNTRRRHMDEESHLMKRLPMRKSVVEVNSVELSW